MQIYKLDILYSVLLFLYVNCTSRLHTFIQHCTKWTQSVYCIAYDFISFAKTVFELFSCTIKCTIFVRCFYCFYYRLYKYIFLCYALFNLCYS